jgi:hypothetical protein
MMPSMKLGLIIGLLAIVGCSSPDPSPPVIVVPGPSADLACGDVDIRCNCNYTSAYPGLVTNAPRCSSGEHIFETCGGCSYGSYAWETRCYCR